jgi:molecular chaperone DnaK (HSP70)
LGTQDSVVVHGRTFTPEFIASLIIRSLAKNLEDYLGGPIYRAIVSAPANFSIAQCNALTKAFELAGVPAFRFMSEPSAAALAAEYRSESRDRDRSYLIVDLGGGTLDVAVVVIEPVVVTLDRSIWEVVSVAGDRNLGGLDYDLAVQRYIESRVREKIRSVDYEFNEADTAQIRSESERVKIDLGTREETHVLLQNFECNAGLYDIDVPISRGLFRALVEDLNRRFLDCVNAALMAGIRFDTKQMDQVFLAGQGAKIFCVRELLEQRFPGVAFEDTFQENAVIYGMGRYSGVFTGIIKDRLLLEVTPFALCIRCREIVTDSSTAESRAEFFVSDDPVKNVLTTFILAPNTTIPTRKSVFGRFDAKPGMKVPLYIVERGLTDASETSVGLIELPVGVLLPEFELTIDIDADRTVKILVHNYSTGQAETYQVNNFFGELARTKKQGELVRLVGT